MVHTLSLNKTVYKVEILRKLKISRPKNLMIGSKHKIKISLGIYYGFQDKSTTGDPYKITTHRILNQMDIWKVQTFLAKFQFFYTLQKTYKGWLVFKFVEITHCCFRRIRFRIFRKSHLVISIYVIASELNLRLNF